MKDIRFINNYVNESKKLISFNKSDKKKISEVVNILNQIKSKKKNKVIIFGNGGSAAISSHVSVDLTKNGGVKCINFNESDLITCFANDYGYSKWMEKSIDFYGDKDDVLILISVSGKSPNILNAAKQARKKKFNKIITFSGHSSNNPLRKLGDINIWVNSKIYNQVENTHQFILLMIIDLFIFNNEKK
mgnify:CR=1 FL=1